MTISKNHWFAMFVSLSAMLLTTAWRVAPASLGTGGDFSSYWLGSFWMREKPAATPLYYPREKPNRPNLRIWTVIRRPLGDQIDPWAFFGAKHGFSHPKFYLYPPVFAMAFAPLTLLQVETAARWWSMINAASLIGGALLIGRMVRDRGVGMAWATAALAGAMAMFPTWWSLKLGQNTLSLFLLWAFFADNLLRKREISAGIFLGLIAAVKLNPLILVAWLALRGRWRAAATATAVFAASICIGTLYVGLPAMRIYVHDLLPVLATGTHFSENQSLTGLLLRLKPLANPINCDPGILGPALRHAIELSSLLLFAITLAPALRNRARGETGIASELAAMQLLLIIISPVSWSHYLALSVLSFALIARDAGALLRTWPVIVIATCSFILQALPQFPLDLLSHSPGRLLVSFRLYGAVMLWLLALWVAWRATSNDWKKPVEQFPNIGSLS